MLFKQLAHAALILASVSSAIHLHERHIELEERGGYGGGGDHGSTYQFAPGIQTATGDTCAVAFGGGYQTCREASGSANRLCYNPDVGQKCCSSSWSCPNGSFCMTDGSCCPNGMDPSSCGAKPETTSSSKTSTSSSSSATSSIPSSTFAVSSTVYSSHNATSSTFISQASYSTAFANATAVKPPTAASGGVYVAPSSTGATIANSAVRASSGAAGLVGAAILAVLASF